jgi:hypothetical protein
VVELVRGTFASRLTQLSEQVGERSIEMKVVVDQVYAKYQHERLDLKHPGGGSAKYLEKPLLTQHASYLRRVADDVLDVGPVHPMIRNAEDLSMEVYRNAPFEFGDLKASGAPSVTDDGAKVYDRPPMVRRLTKEELRAKGQLRALGLGNERG